MLMGKMGYRTQEPIELNLSPEEPTLFKEIVTTYIDDMAFSINDLSNLIYWQAPQTEALLVGSSRLAMHDVSKKTTIKDIEDFLNTPN